MCDIEPRMTRQISSSISNQRNNSTCWAFAVSRTILKFIKSVSPELQSLPTDSTVCDKYYDYDKFSSSLKNKNRFFFKQAQLPNFFKCISARRCGEKEYKNLCVFMFIYYQITNQFGCEGYDEFYATKWFVLKFLTMTNFNRQGSLLPNPYNSVAIDIIMSYHMSDRKRLIYTNNVRYETNTDTKNMTIYSSLGDRAMKIIQPDDENMFNTIIKNVINNNLYATINLDVLGDNTFSFISHRKGKTRKKYAGCLFPSTEIYETYNDPRGPHTMTIVDYIDDPDDPLVVIKNSWGIEWGEDGTITIPMSELKTRCILEICYLSFTSLVEEMQIYQEKKLIRSLEPTALGLRRRLRSVHRKKTKRNNK